MADRKYAYVPAMDAKFQLEVLTGGGYVVSFEKGDTQIGYASNRRSDLWAWMETKLDEIEGTVGPRLASPVKRESLNRLMARSGSSAFDFSGSGEETNEEKT